jgi:hypothetical protein
MESGPDTNIVETVGSARGGSDIDLFSYGKSIVNLDAKVAHRALDPVDCRCAGRSRQPLCVVASVFHDDPNKNSPGFLLAAFK